MKAKQSKKKKVVRPKIETQEAKRVDVIQIKKDLHPSIMAKARAAQEAKNQFIEHYNTIGMALGVNPETHEFDLKTISFVPKKGA